MSPAYAQREVVHESEMDGNKNNSDDKAEEGKDKEAEASRKSEAEVAAEKVEKKAKREKARKAHAWIREAGRRVLSLKRRRQRKNPYGENFRDRCEDITLLLLMAGAGQDEACSWREFKSGVALESAIAD